MRSQSKAGRRAISGVAETLLAGIIALTVGAVLVVGATATGRQAELCSRMQGVYNPTGPGELCLGGSWKNVLKAKPAPNALAPGRNADFFECAPGATLKVCAVGESPAGECRAVGSGTTTLAFDASCS